MTDVHFDTLGFDSRLLAPPVPMRRFHLHHEIELNYVFRGKVTYLLRGGLQTLKPHQLVLFWGSTPHNLMAAEPGTEMAWITVPLSWVWMWQLPAKFTQKLMDGRWWLAPRSAIDQRFPVRSWVSEMANATPLRQRALSLELQACFLWMAEHSTLHRSQSPPTLTQDANHLKHIEAMARCMAERFREECDVAEIARAAGLHPNYAMPLFRQHCGVTIHDYLMQLRLTHAQRLLITTDQKVIDVALASGFRSLSAFYEAFTKFVKKTPHAFRKKSLIAHASADSLSPQPARRVQPARRH